MFACALFSASGNGNGSSWNNRGSNGNYWSASFNSSRNARNLNFNSGGVSYLGIMSHTASYNLRRSMFGEGEFAELIEYDADMRKGWLVT